MPIRRSRSLAILSSSSFFFCITSQRDAVCLMKLWRVHEKRWNFDVRWEYGNLFQWFEYYSRANRSLNSLIEKKFICSCKLSDSGTFEETTDFSVVVTRKSTLIWYWKRFIRINQIGLRFQLSANLVEFRRGRKVKRLISLNDDSGRRKLEGTNLSERFSTSLIELEFEEMISTSESWRSTTN